VRARLIALAAQLRWTWVTGNHDAAMTDPLGGHIAVEAEVDGLILRHQADVHDPRPEISGHFHPKLRLSLRGRHVSRRCFVRSDTKLVLPAFGALTGGLDAGHAEILRAVGQRAEALVPVADRLLRFPLGG
jgi:metallophosphoesterase superfamily enzyme